MASLDVEFTVNILPSFEAWVPPAPEPELEQREEQVPPVIIIEPPEKVPEIILEET